MTNIDLDVEEELREEQDCGCYVAQDSDDPPRSRLRLDSIDRFGEGVEAAELGLHCLLIVVQSVVELQYLCRSHSGYSGSLILTVCLLVCIFQDDDTCMRLML